MVVMRSCLRNAVVITWSRSLRSRSFADRRGQPYPPDGLDPDDGMWRNCNPVTGQARVHRHGGASRPQRQLYDPDVLANGYVTEIDYPKYGKRLKATAPRGTFPKRPPTSVSPVNSAPTTRKSSPSWATPRRRLRISGKEKSFNCRERVRPKRARAASTYPRSAGWCRQKWLLDSGSRRE